MLKRRRCFSPSGLWPLRARSSRALSQMVAATENRSVLDGFGSAESASAGSIRRRAAIVDSVLMLVASRCSRFCCGFQNLANIWARQERFLATSEFFTHRCLIAHFRIVLFPSLRRMLQVCRRIVRAEFLRCRFVVGVIFELFIGLRPSRSSNYGLESSY